VALAVRGERFSTLLSTTSTGASTTPVLSRARSLCSTRAVPSDFTHGSAHSPAGPDTVVTQSGGESPNRVETIYRLFLDGINAPVSGEVNLAYFTSNINKTINTLRIIVGTTGYTVGTGGPPTARLGLYTVAANGDLTLVARTAPIAAASFTASTAVTAVLATTGGFPASYDMLYGVRYALAVIWLDNGGTGHVIPQFWRFSGTGPSSTMRGNMFAYAPRLTGQQAGQTDLPASIGFASVANTSNVFYLAAYNSADTGV
jgi:hypothetical protein